MSTTVVHGVQDVRDAASVLGLESYVGPLGDMSNPKPRVQQSFDHNLLSPARLEIKRGLSAGFFEGSHVDLARQLLGRIKNLQRTRDERDRKRRLGEKEKQVCMLLRTAGKPHDSPATVVLHALRGSLAQQLCTAVWQ